MIKRVTILYPTDKKVFKDDGVLLTDNQSTNLAVTISDGELNMDFVKQTAEPGVYTFVEGSPITGVPCADGALLNQLETMTAAEFLRALGTRDR